MTEAVDVHQDQARYPQRAQLLFVDPVTTTAHAQRFDIALDVQQREPALLDDVRIGQGEHAFDHGGFVGIQVVGIAQDGGQRSRAAAVVGLLPDQVGVAVLAHALHRGGVERPVGQHTGEGHLRRARTGRRNKRQQQRQDPGQARKQWSRHLGDSCWVPRDRGSSPVNASGGIDRPPGMDAPPHGGGGAGHPVSSRPRRMAGSHSLRIP